MEGLLGRVLLDPATGLPNLPYFEVIQDWEAKRAERRNYLVRVLDIRIDGGGETTRRSIGWRLRQLLRASDLIASRGTDYFRVLLTSPGGRETLHIGHLDGYAVTGAFTDASGRTSRFAAFRATDGAGIYDVTLDEALRYAGRSTDGSELVGRAFEDGSVVGTIFAANGQEIPFHIETLARLSEEDLQAAGLPTDYRSYADNSLVPDSYVALISPAGLFWLGRSGNVRAGSPGNSIIGLDMGD